jgi:hypothetical protein
MLEFEAIDLNAIGGKTNLQDRQWANLALRFQDTETDHRRVVELNVMVPKRPDATIRELEEAARSDAQATLAAALQVLQGSSVAELTAREFAADQD